MRQLRAYQVEGFNKFKDRNSAFFGMEMRLGKTLLCIRWLKHKGAKRILVIAPKTVLISWEDELEEECCPFRTLIGEDLVNRVVDIFVEKNVEYFLLNYESVANLKRAIKHGGFDAVVLDESTAIKNVKAGVTKSLIELCDEIPYKACLSGLPTPQSWEDIFTQMAFLNDGSFMNTSNFYSWRNRHTRKYGFERIFTPSAVQTIKAEFHRRAYVLTRKQAGIGECKVYTKRSCPLKPAIRKLYDQILKTWEVPGEGEEPDESTKYAMVVSGWLQRLCGGFLPGKEYDCWKYDELIRIVSSELSSDSIVVWFAWNEELERCRRVLSDNSVSHTYIHGGVTSKNRKERQRGFQSGKYRVILMQQKIGKMGIRLDRADTAIYFSNSYNYELRGQSEDRIVQVEKEDRPLLYIDFVTEGTVEEHVIEALRNKKTNSRWLMAKIQKDKALALRGSRSVRNRNRRVEREKPSAERKRFIVKRRMDK